MDRSKSLEPEFLGMTLIREPLKSSNRVEISQLYKWINHDYINYIKLQHVDTGATFLSSPVQVFCECPDFLNRCVKDRAADHSLFLTPEIINRYLQGKNLMENKGGEVEWKLDPNDIGLCKHLISSFEDLRLNFLVRSYGARKSCVKFKNLIEKEAQEATKKK